MDERRRRLERAYRDQDADAQAPLLAELIRSGSLTYERVAVAASLGHRPANAVLSSKVDPQEVGRVARADWPHEAHLRFCLALCVPAEECLLSLEDSARFPPGALGRARAAAAMGVPLLEAWVLGRRDESQLNAILEGLRTPTHLVNDLLAVTDFNPHPIPEEVELAQETPDQTVELAARAVDVVQSSLGLALLEPAPGEDDDAGDDRGRLLWYVEQQSRIVLGVPRERFGQLVTLDMRSAGLWVNQDRAGGAERLFYVVANELIPWAIGVGDPVAERHQARGS